MAGILILLFGVFFILFMASLVALVWWKGKRRGTRHPFPEKVSLLGGPGETQLKIVREIDESLFFWICLGSGVPALLFLGLISIGQVVPVQLGWSFVWTCLALSVALLLWEVRVFSKKIVERGDRYLGYFGERYVAQCLEPLKRKGWYVFHDVPAESSGVKFNLDHVAVGPQGVFVIETKARRKAKRGSGPDAARVIFDGENLNWPKPKGIDSRPLIQAEGNAKWLEAALQSDTHLQIEVEPVVTIPGWFIEPNPPRSRRSAKVAITKSISDFLSGGREKLDEETIEKVKAALARRCRTVKY